MSARVISQFVLALLVALLVDFPTHSSAAGEADLSPLFKDLIQVELFGGLSDEDFEALAKTAALRHGEAGERLVEQGKIQDRMFIILSGEARVLVNGILVATLSGQSLVGEMEFLDMLPASADVVLVNETDIIELNNDSLNDLMEKQPRLGYVIMRRIAEIECQRLRASNLK